MDTRLGMLEAVFDAIKVGVIVIDNANQIVLFNRIAGEMLQVDPKQRIGSPVLRCHGEVSEAPVLKMIEDLRSGRIKQSESWIDYRGRIIYEHLYPIRDSEGNYLGIVDELHDAAERAQYLKSKGEWKEIHTSGIGKKAPRSPFPDHYQHGSRRE